MAPEQTTSVPTAERRRWWDEDLRPFFPLRPEGDDFLLIAFRPRRVEVMSFAHKVASEPASWAPAVLEWEGGRWVRRERTRRG